jgi:hypothetical protein
MKDNDLLIQIAANLTDFRKEINNKVDSLATKVANLDKQTALQAKDIEFIKQEDAQQNKLLEEHIAGVKEVRNQNILLKEQLWMEIQSKNEALEKRVKKLEKPGEWLKTTIWLMVTLGGAAYGIYQILEFLQILK